MPCFSPLTAYYSKAVGKSGKRGITFQRSAAFSPVKLKLPCGQCIGCRLEHSRQWAMRCMHEKQLHMDNVFLTITYDDKKLPHGGTLVVRDLQLFMKRLRKWYWAKYRQKVRFYACGEYGENFGRPHYHILLFNCDFVDKKPFKKAKAGQVLYTSKAVSVLWPHGFHLLGSVDFDSCAYVARYIVKKVRGAGAAEHYTKVLSDGEVIDMVPEFTVMSRRPGIGREWYHKFGKQAYVWDSVIVNGKEVKPPRYYDTLYELEDSKRMAALKVTRRRHAMKSLKEQSPDRRRVREVVTMERLKLKGRQL